MNVFGLNGKKYFSLKMRCFYESISIYKYEWWCFLCYFYFYVMWMNDLDFIMIVILYFVMYYCYIVNGMVRMIEI